MNIIYNLTLIVLLNFILIYPIKTNEQIINVDVDNKEIVETKINEEIFYSDNYDLNILFENNIKEILYGFWIVENIALESRFYFQDEYKRSSNNLLIGKVVKINENFEMSIDENTYHPKEVNAYNAVELSNYYRLVYNSVLSIGTNFYVISYKNDEIERDSFNLIIPEIGNNVYIYAVYLDNIYNADCSLYLLKAIDDVSEKG